MASATRLPIKSIVFTTAIIASASASRLNLRNLLINTFTGPGSYSRITALAILLANIKNVPFAWHWRIFRSILNHCIFNKRHIPPAIASSTIFLPVITSSYSPLYESDYNFHKSNSTYFSDLDITRSHLVCCLLQPGIEKLHYNTKNQLVLDKDGNSVKGRFNIMLGSVMCSFKREIGMYEGFEMWSRFLCWDRKWIYVVTHFVKKGSVRPKSYILKDGSWFGRKGYRTVNDGGKGGEDVDEKAIFASAISKYVIKLGRLTVHPEVVLGASGLLPSKPGGWATMSGSSGESTPELEVVETNDAVPEGESKVTDEWDWRRIEAENHKGLKYVEHFAALDGLHSEFTGSKEPALGRYTDFLL